MQEPTTFSFDALVPPQMAGKAENVGVSKAQLSSFRMLHCLSWQEHLSRWAPSSPPRPPRAEVNCPMGW